MVTMTERSTDICPLMILDVLDVLLYGVIVGFLLAAPFGPAGALCFRQTLAHGGIGGMACGFGTATADALIGGIAFVSVGLASKLLDEYLQILETIAGLVLVGIGIAALMEVGRRNLEGGPDRGRLASASGQAFMVTAGNPAVLGAFMALFAAIGRPGRPMESLGQTLLATETAFLMLGVFIGSLMCWILFVYLVTHASRRLADKWLDLAERILGVILVVAGATVLAAAFYPEWLKT